MATGLIGGLALAAFVGLPGLWQPYPEATGPSHALWMTACAVGLLWVRRLPVPSILHVAVGGVGAASFYIYLTHVVPVFVVFWWLGVKNLALNLTVAVGVGLLAWWAAERVGRWRGVHSAAAE